MGIKGLKWLKKTKKFRVVCVDDFANDMGKALGRLGLTIDKARFISAHEVEMTGKWTPDFYGDERTMEALTDLPVREAVVF